MARITPETRERVGRGIGSLPASTEVATFLPVTDPEMLAMYEQALADAGGDTRAAYAQTGFYSGPETGGQLVREISDANARLIGRDLLLSGEELRLSDVLDHPELFRERPDLADIPISAPSDSALRYMNALGGYTPDGGVGSVEINPDALDPGFGPNTIRDDYSYDRSLNPVGTISDEEILSLILHEVGGHGVQHTSGLPTGSNLIEGWIAQGLALEDAQKLLDQSQLEELMALPLDPLQPSFPLDYYRAIPGEAAARLIEARSRMTPDQLRASYPPDMLDVSEDRIRYATELERRLQEGQ